MSPRIVLENRALSARLYGGDQEMRLCQEFLLGIGGVRMLRALDIAPTVWHANEGHSAFLTLERIRELIQKGSTHADAVRRSGKAQCLPPIHRAAGHDVFPDHLWTGYFTGYWEQSASLARGLPPPGGYPESRGTWLQHDGTRHPAGPLHVNGVSREHGQVSRDVAPYVAGRRIEQVRIRSVTNGIDAPTCTAPELNQLNESISARNGRRNATTRPRGQRVLDIRPGTRAECQTMKTQTDGFIRKRAGAAA